MVCRSLSQASWSSAVTGSREVDIPVVPIESLLVESSISAACGAKVGYGTRHDLRCRASGRFKELLGPASSSIYLELVRCDCVARRLRALSKFGQASLTGPDTVATTLPHARQLWVEARQ